MAIKINKPAPPSAPSHGSSSGKFEIFEDIPIPVKKRTEYNFEDIAVAKMMFVPVEDEDLGDPSKVQNRVAASASGWGKRHGRKFVTQLITHNGRLGVGVWRTE